MMIWILIVLTVRAQCKAEFTYDNQEAWGDLSSICSEGRKQSPINLPTTERAESCASSKNLRAFWNRNKVSFKLVIDEQLRSTFAESTLVVFSNETGNYTYTSQQLHFHLPSEHTIDGRHFDLEMHIVHSNSALTEYGVIGIFLELGPDTDQDIFSLVGPDEETLEFLMQATLIHNAPAYHYQGSFTKPGCFEIVNWFLLSQPIKIKQLHLDYLRKRTNSGHGNNRRISELHDRKIYLLGNNPSRKQSQ